MSDNMDDSFELATVGTRFIAVIIDGVILGIITAVLFGAARETGGGISFLVGVAYYWYFMTRQAGQTPGKKLLNIRVIRTDNQPLSDADAVIRYIGYYINSIVFMLGWIWVLFDAKSQGWHDKIAKTYVVVA